MYYPRRASRYELCAWLCDDTARSSANVSAIPHAAWADLRRSRPTDSGVVGGVPPGARRGAARAERRRGVELYRWLPGLLGVFNL